MSTGAAASATPSWARLPPFAAVVLAGGTGARMDGADKATLDLGGHRLLDLALAATVDAAEVVVVGDPVPTARPVSFTREDPLHGGPAAALLAGVDALTGRYPMLAVLACDMPRVTAATVQRLREAAAGRDGAALTGPDGRSQLALVLDTDRLAAVAPGPAHRHGLALHRMLADLDLADVPAVDQEHRDVDTWADLRGLTP